jgi:hypothetical protein
MTYLNLDQFKATKKEVADLAAVGIETGMDDPQPGFLYDDYCYINKLPEGGFHLVIETSEWLDDDLGKLERILWALHYVFDQGALLDVEDGTLDQFIIAVCEAHDKPVDGDLFGILFSDVSRDGKWPVREAYEIAHGAFSSELYAQEG